MKKAPKKGENDRLYLVRLKDTKSQSRVTVGKFWAESHNQAIETAKRLYPRLFARMETNTWKMECDDVTLPARAEAPGAQSAAVNI